ncbi:MAG: hypothetical protein NTW12_09490 [Deltaproteobacteria bacterium]|nr:hypothetical protein [Deltaproteobacteria bacterium]
MKNKILISLVFVLFFIGLSAVTLFAYETTYTYDKLNRLTSATYNAGTSRNTIIYQYDAAGNRLSKITKIIVTGDLNGDTFITLADAIMTMQVLSGITPNQSIVQSAEVNSDGKIGMPEAIYILQKAADLR